MAENRKDLISDKKIAVLMGGVSSEREISLRSGRNVLAALKRLGFNAVGIDVDRNLDQRLRDAKPDIAFIALHGSDGEGGGVQGMLDVLEIPYTGSGVMGSVIAMDKILTKRVLVAEQIALPVYRVINNEPLEDVKQMAEEIGYPLILKPVAEGSSVGVLLIHNSAELLSGVTEFRERFSKLFIEQFVRGRELTVGALVSKEGVQILPYLELEPENEFYDYESKYTKGKTRFILSASVESQTREKIDFAVRRTIELLDLRGVPRIDFIVDEHDIPWLLEVNTIPGMTETSDIPAMAKAAGMDFDTVVLKILESLVIQ